MPLPFEEGLPRGLRFSGAPLPREDVLGMGDRDEQAPGADVDPVELELVVAGFDGPEGGFEVPTPGRVPAEGSGCCRGGVFGLGVFPLEPGEEIAQLVPAGEVGAAAGAGGAAVSAAPSLCAGGSRAVLDECVAAYQTSAAVVSCWHS
jgi:hypothetical protein